MVTEAVFRAAVASSRVACPLSDEESAHPLRLLVGVSRVFCEVNRVGRELLAVVRVIFAHAFAFALACVIVRGNFENLNVALQVQFFGR